MVVGDEIIEMLDYIHEYIGLLQFFNVPCHIELICKGKEALYHQRDVSSFHSHNLIFNKFHFLNDTNSDDDCESVCDNDCLIDNQEEMHMNTTNNNESNVYKGTSEISKQYKNKEITIKCTINSTLNETKELQIKELKVIIIYDYDIMASIDPVIINGLKKGFKNYFLYIVLNLI